MKKKSFFFIFLLTLVLSMAGSLSVAAQTDMQMDQNMALSMSTGPLVAGQMIHVYVDLVAFFITMYLVIKIGTGKIRLPIVVFALAFLSAALIPLIWGHGAMWVMALVKSSLGFIGVLMFIQIFGGKSLLFPKKETPQS